MAAIAADTRSADGIVRGLPLALLRTEGAALLGLAILLYAKFGGSWILFAVLILAPDLGALGYVRDTRFGALTYDVVHTYVPPAVLAAIGVLADNNLVLSIGIIWFGHIGMDRLVGFGLKYPDSFGHTHLGWKGRMGRAG